ncbi:hypothetical protein [Rubellimicrobium arenae]|uniref:hypothetical protein n=1 Tax=Rubellimicrobium arenae TaxID=2817372 RepID=UPI001B30285F|nr:hypothetical protein [Rubellimicrobium arenae]
MIRFIVTPGFNRTVRSLTEAKFGVPTPPCRAVTYPDLFAARRVPAGTYVFCDLERLSDIDLVTAAELHRALAATGRCRVLNDPARVRTRYALLRGLHEAGINGFDAYPAHGWPRPRRFPVFVRSEAEHLPALTDLLPDQAALESALEDLARRGRPLRGLVVIEYCAQPVAPGIFRRYGTFRIGAAVQLDHIVTEDSWNVKWGKAGLVGEDTYRADDAAVRGNDHADVLARAFEVAGIDYGRADFGLVDGRPQIYEINTNPSLGELHDHPSATRRATMRHSHERFAEMLGAIDTPDAKGMVRLPDGARLVPLRRSAERRARAEQARAEEAAAELARLRAERDALQEERDKARRRVAALRRDKEALAAERAALADAQAALRAEAGRLGSDVTVLRRRLRAVTGSMSWRLTGPLRAGRAILRRRGLP